MRFERGVPDSSITCLGQLPMIGAWEISDTIMVAYIRHRKKDG